MAVWRFALALLLPFLAATAAVGAEDCTLKQAASVPMEIGAGDLPTITVQMNGVDKPLLIDTGAFLSFVSSRTVQELGLKQAKKYVAIRTATGEGVVPGYRVDTLQLGQLLGKNNLFFLAPEGLLPRRDAGSFGNDFLRAWDVEFDFTQNRFNLFSPDHCKGAVVYWTKQTYTELPFKLTSSTHLRVQAIVDGHKLKALIDTGTTVTTINLRRARKIFGWKTDPPELKPLPAPSYMRWRNPAPNAFVYPFQSLSLEGIEVHNPFVAVMADIETGDEDMVIGMSMLQKLHMYVAYRERVIYITPVDAR